MTFRLGGALGALFLTCASVSTTGCSSPPEQAAESEDPVMFPATNRPEVRGVRGAVSAGHPLAAAAGNQVLLEGGNAMDAAIAMAGVLAVVRPHMNGVGGDAFGLVYDAESGSVHGLNGSGRAGAHGEPGFFTEGAIPETGAGSITVPGAVAAWADALDRFGTWPLSRALEPAVRYARDGFPVSNRLRYDFETQSAALGETGRTLYLPGGSPPQAGTLLQNPALAGTLERIAAGGANGFYRGPVAARLASFVEGQGGHLTVSDFESHRSEWVDPIQADYLEHRVHVLPPNTQGFAQLQLMMLADALETGSMEHNSPDYLHALVEAKKLAFADRNQWAADPAFASIPLDRLLDRTYAVSRAGEVDSERAASSVEAGVELGRAPVADGGGGAGLDDSGDTVYLTAVDQWGNAVSWIQSLFHGFGSGLLEPETGVLLHNRGALFTLTEGHPNQIMPGKRPYHTLTPMMALRSDGELAFTLGTPGGDGQTQTLIQIVNNMFMFDMTPQAAIEAPRFRSYPGLDVAVEDRIPLDVRAALVERGHVLEVVPGWTSTFGGAQMILRDPQTGTLTAAADPRREAYALAH